MPTHSDSDPPKLYYATDRFSIMPSLPELLDALLGDTRASVAVLSNDGLVRAQRFRDPAHRMVLGDLLATLLDQLHPLAPDPTGGRRLLELFHPRGELVALPIDDDHDMVIIAGPEDDAVALAEHAEARRDELTAALAAEDEGAAPMRSE